MIKHNWEQAYYEYTMVMLWDPEKHSVAAFIKRIQQMVRMDAN